MIVSLHLTNKPMRGYMSRSSTIKMDLGNRPTERLSMIEIWLNHSSYRKGYESVREITIGDEDLPPNTHVSFNAVGMDWNDKAVRSEVWLGSEIHISLSPRKRRKVKDISMVDEDLRFINFVSFTFAEMDLRHSISNLHCPLQFKRDDVNYTYWQKNWCEQVMFIYDIGMMTAVEFWECRSSLGIYLRLLWFDE
jgi:hypothetical protein